MNREDIQAWIQNKDEELVYTPDPEPIKIGVVALNYETRDLDFRLHNMADDLTKDQVAASASAAVLRMIDEIYPIFKSYPIDPNMPDFITGHVSRYMYEER